MTVEEMAGEYAEKTEAEYGFDMHPKTASFQGFIDGYSEALRWRDPKEELPIDSCDVLVKTDEGRYYACYFCLEREGFFHEYCRLQGVIGWRPIE